VTRALILFALLAAAVAASGCCQGITRSYVIDAPDPDLRAVLQACVDSEPCFQNGEHCISPECLTACARVVDLAGDSGGGSIDSCGVSFAMDGGTGARVSVSFRGCGL
jgi:hypothetical protein